MGSFSWYASDTHRAIRSANPFPVYALQPDGEPLLEKRYENNGVFCGRISTNWSQIGTGSFSQSIPAF